MLDFPPTLGRRVQSRYRFAGISDMHFAAPEYSKGAVNRAGDALRDGVESEEDLKVINNWRASHGFPLQVIKMLLKNRARVTDKQATVPRRLKRLPSIRNKLVRDQTSKMELARMQDIGGCRAVISDIEALQRLAQAFREGFAKNPVGRHRLVGQVDDYIANPKADGYRGIHYAVRYATNTAAKKIYDGHRIEIQIKTRLQHAWATAVETVDTLTNQRLKFALNSNVGDESWKRFFALMGSVLAIREDKPLVPGTPADLEQLADELRYLTALTGVQHVLGGLHTVVEVLEEDLLEGSHDYLVILNSETKTVAIQSYAANEFDKIQQEYLRIERENDPNVQVVQVSVDDLKALKLAFPNYYLDTTIFLAALNEAIE